MAIARTVHDLKRLSTIAALRRAIEVRTRAIQAPDIGLAEVAEFCRRYAAVHPRDCNDIRDQILAIGCAWDLGNDTLAQQSDECLAALIEFIQGRRP